MSHIKFIELNVLQGEKSYPVWFRADLITRIAFGKDGRTHIDYLESGHGAPSSDYIVKERPDRIVDLIESVRINFPTVRK